MTVRLKLCCLERSETTGIAKIRFQKFTSLDKCVVMGNIQTLKVGVEAERASLKNLLPYKLASSICCPSVRIWPICWVRNCTLR